MPIISKAARTLCPDSSAPFIMSRKISSLHPAFIMLIIALLFILMPAELLPYELEKRVEKTILSNGLTVLILERHTSPTVSLYIRHRVGAVDEISSATGTAHFLEHLMFKGTKTIGTKNYQAERKILLNIHSIGNLLDREKMKGELADNTIVSQLKKKLSALQERHRLLIMSNEIDRLYTENGAVGLNASTGQDFTTYHVSLPANKLELWARIESDRMTNLVFREFYQERDVIMEERSQSVESDPDGKLMEQFLATAFQAHPYGRPVLGWPSDMAFLNPDTVMNFYRQYHAPNNTVIAIVGDIKAQSVVAIIKKYFGGIKRQHMQSFHITEEPPQMGERRVEVLFPANPQVIIGYHKPSLPSTDDYVFDVIDSILSHGRTSRFYKSLVEEKGIAEGVQTANGYPAARYPNLFTIFAAPRQNHTTAELEAEIYKEIEKLTLKPVAAEEIEKTKNQLKADFIRSLASNSGLASKLSYYEILAGDYRYLINHINVIEKITPEDIMRTAKKYLSSENRTVATLVKK
jgi:predicted Zn-dependent peptidase